MRFWILLLFLSLCVPRSDAQERRVYEGVVGLKKKTIGTVILLEIEGNSVSGWIRLEEFVPIEGGTASKTSAEFQAAGNRYRIDERGGKIAYSGPEGSGNRYAVRLVRLTGILKELVEDAQFSGGEIAAMEVRGRRRDLRFGRPALWKRQGQPFENFSRLEEVLGREISVWVAGADDRSGRIVVVEEPEGMEIPLKASKK